ncbi:hypothetical protein OA84_05020 [Kaistella solincola]|uniref:Gliding motility-associated C-terminal domain-containing protein n=1 Tax=Kaistella solincola TaxID=510955 RepID=A0ABR4ZNP7_9FLAO|nr:T9SS type B sorting domain-containing protein [Kaistella solincola]KIA82932.1 hypothetical protein OA84_05020 [Kaistella solincola]
MAKKVFFLYTILLFTFQVSAQQTNTAPKITDSRGNQEAKIDCNYPLTGNCLELQVKDVPVLSETTSYNVSSIPYSPPAPYNSGTKLNAGQVADDRFTDQISLPFGFCYFGNSYNQVVVGNNGVVSFDAVPVGSQNYPNVVNSNPSKTLPQNSIFGIYQDLIFSKNEDSEIYYQTIGSAPARKFIVSFYRGTIWGCEGYTSTTQIVLSEGTNTVEIFVENKPAPCNGAKFKNSLLGIINSDGSLGYSPPNRNTGIWSAQKEAWKFTPAGSPVVPTLSWYNSANEKIGNGEKISVCPVKNEIYTVKIEYPVCGTIANILQDEFPVTFAANFPVLKDYTNVFCGAASQVVNLDDYAKNLTTQDPTKFKFSFHPTLLDAQNGTNPLAKTYTVGNSPVYVRAENKDDASCFQTAVLSLSLIATSILTDTVSLCDINNDGVESNVDLSILDQQLFTLPIDGTLRYFLSRSDAENNTNQVTKTTLNNSTQLFVKYESSTCSNIFGPIRVNFLQSPPIPAPVSYPPITICDELSDGAEPFDFLSNLGPLIRAGGANASATLTFYENQNDAYAGLPSNLKTIHEGQYPIYVRVQNPGDICFSIAVVNLDVTFNKVLAENAAIDVCFNGTSMVVPVDLDVESKKMLAPDQPGITTAYFVKFADAVNNINAIPALQNVTINGSFETKIFYVRFTDQTGCYALKTLELNLIKIVVKPEAVVCDVGLDGQETVILTNLEPQIIGSQKVNEVTYYINETDAQNKTNPQTSLLVSSGGEKIWVRVESACATQIQAINITLGETPVVVSSVAPTIADICDNNNDGKEPFDITQFERSIFTGTTTVKFQYYTAYNSATNTLSGYIADPKAFPVKGSTIVYAKVINAGECFSVSTLNLNIKFKPVIVLNQKIAPLQKCDFQNDANETFELKDAIPQLFEAAKNTYSLNDLTVRYYKTKANAEAGINPIPSTYNTSANGTITLWARFTSNSQSCYSVAPINLLIAYPPKAQSIEITGLCDNNLDGLFEADLTQYTSQIILGNSVNLQQYTFKFFKTENEANNLASAPIANPASYSFPSTLTRLWVRVENAPGCFDVVPVELKYGKKVPLKSGQSAINVCDANNDNNEVVDLTQLQNAIYGQTATFEYFESLADLYAGNKISTPAAYSLSGNAKKIFVKVHASGYCAEKTEITVNLKKTPMFTIPDQYFCLQEPANIQPNFSGLNITKFEWVDASGKVVSTSDKLLDVKTGGRYKINVTSANGCTFSTEFNVKPFEVPIINSVVLNGKIFTVNASGDKPILYSSDGVKFQTSNLFNADNLPFGVNTFYVKFANSACLGEPKNGLKLQNAFTPNSDGINDTWLIDQLDLFNGEKLNLKIYNRYQEKIYEQESATRLEWDGKTLSRVVATDSYWYVLTLPDGKVYTGWVLLKNRD